jgi:hypothetical protein
MYRPVPPAPQSSGPPLSSVFFSERNTQTLYTVLSQEIEEKQRLEPAQRARLSKVLDHYQQEVFQKLGDGSKPLSILNREVLVACSKDFHHYLQRKEVVKQQGGQAGAVQQVMATDQGMFENTAQRLERLNKERQGVKALPPPAPDFRISLSEDGPPAAELFERAKKAREQEALRAAAASASQALTVGGADAGLQRRIQADSQFRTQQNTQNRASEELAIVQRNPVVYPSSVTDTSLVVLPDRRDMYLTPIGSFDGMSATVTASATKLVPNAAGGNSTVASADVMGDSGARLLPQSTVTKEEPVIHYREVENNLFLYSADRDWLKNNKENRYQFTVSFDPAANGQSFGTNLSAQHKFKNIVRIELVKAILPGENLDVTVQRVRGADVTSTGIQNNILSLPYLTVRVAELENNNYGTDQHLDRSFGVLQYDAQWLGDTTAQACTKGFLAMIPKFLKCQKEYYPTPLSTLQKMTIEICRPNGQLVSASPDTFDIGGVIGSQTGEVMGAAFPFTNTIKYSDTPLTYNVMMPIVNGSPANFYVNTTKYFSKFEMCAGDRIQISGYSYAEEALNDPTYGGALRAFCQWINRPEGHVVLDAAYSVGFDLSSGTSSMRNGFNEVGYANFLVIPARYRDPTTGSTEIDPFAVDFGAVLNAFGVSLQSPVRLINLNKQTSLVFRIITREMDSLPQLRPDNNY